jgi:hypothetical protein
MKRASPPHKQQLNSTGRCDDSVVVDNGITDEVANKEKQAIRSNKRILIVDDEPDIAFTLRIILEVVCSLIAAKYNAILF